LGVLLLVIGAGLLAWHYHTVTEDGLYFLSRPLPLVSSTRSCPHFYGVEPYRGRGVNPQGSTDDLVGLEEERRGDGQAQVLRGLEVDGELEFRGLLHRQIGRLGALEDSVHIVGHAPPNSDIIIYPYLTA
jgi:hypothetical protein